MTNSFDDIFEEIFPIESVKNYEEGNYASEADEISPDQVNLKSFDEKDTLCPSVFNLKTGDLKKVIRKRLIKIARDFISNIDEFPEIRIYDIILVGSLAQFNWSKYSDVDLHVVVDYSKLNKYGTKETLQSIFDRIKDNFNKNHEILIYGFPVEMYVQDVSVETNSNGIYSILYGRWQKIPKSRDGIKDRELIKTTAAKCINLINKYEELAHQTRSIPFAEMLIEETDKIYDQVVRARKFAIAKDGEQAAGNIIFKVLRRSGHIQKMKDIKTYLYDKINSLYTEFEK